MVAALPSRDPEMVMKGQEKEMSKMKAVEVKSDMSYEAARQKSFRLVNGVHWYSAHSRPQSRCVTAKPAARHLYGGETSEGRLVASSSGLGAVLLGRAIPSFRPKSSRRLGLKACKRVDTRAIGVRNRQGSRLRASRGVQERAETILYLSLARLSLWRSIGYA